MPATGGAHTGAISGPQCGEEGTPFGGQALLAQAGSVCVDPFVTHDVVNAFSHRTVFGHTVPHALEKLGPVDLVQSGEVHETLPIHTKVVQESDVGLDRSPDLFMREFVRLDGLTPVPVIDLLERRISVEFV